MWHLLVRQLMSESAEGAPETRAAYLWLANLAALEPQAFLRCVPRYRCEGTGADKKLMKGGGGRLSWWNRYLPMLAAQMERAVDWHPNELLTRRVPLVLYYVVGLLDVCRPTLLRDPSSHAGVAAVWRVILAIWRTLARQPAALDEFKPVVARGCALAAQLVLRSPRSFLGVFASDTDDSSDLQTLECVCWSPGRRRFAPTPPSFANMRLLCVQPQGPGCRVRRRRRAAGPAGAAQRRSQQRAADRLHGRRLRERRRLSRCNDHGRRGAPLRPSRRALGRSVMAAI